MAVEVRIETAPKYRNDHAVEIIFTIINNTDQDIYVLKWQTPLEGLKSDCLNVTVNGHKVKYDGKLVKRGEPRKENYVFIKARDSVSVKVNLDEAYDVSEQGEYAVTFDERKLVVLHEGNVLESISDATETEDLEVIRQPSNFRIEAGAKPRRTIGERMRAKEKKKEVTELILEAVPQLKDPKFSGGTKSKKIIVGIAHRNGYDYAVEGLKKVGDNADYREWFGRHSMGREDKVRENLMKVKEAMEANEFTYNLRGTDCEEGDYAYTYEGVTRIWICALFWDAPSTGVASKAGTLVHEHTHASAGVDDIRNQYGEEKCRRLAINKPDDAIRNADNYEFFVELSD